MKVIITGSEGFIGSALSLALQKRGIEVIGIDRKNGREAADISQYMPDDLDAVFYLAIRCRKRKCESCLRILAGTITADILAVYNKICEKVNKIFRQE
ncbi:MAG: NAD-dependent epimerase/dehydratase family protein [Bacteroides sp.]|nr:NAD-dependent epimerase/dehydratase family protein [Bacteroides sp.]MCM1390375.1 NAD-dependent epimerase/dehydratase family protein [Bacteroides sp.]